VKIRYERKYFVSHNECDVDRIAIVGRGDAKIYSDEKTYSDEETIIAN